MKTDKQGPGLSDERLALARILAMQDAIWVPMRSWTPPAPTNRYEARKAFPETGVSWTYVSGDESGRRAELRTLESLAKAGKIRLRRKSGSPVPHVKLSDATEDRTRSVVGLPMLAAGWWSTHEVHRRSTRPPLIVDHLLISEQALTGLGWPKEPNEVKVFKAACVMVEDMALPALSRGWLLAHADRHGRVYYQVTAAGLAVLDGPCPAEVRVQVNRAARQVYLDAISEAGQRLDSKPTECARELGYLPIPENHVGLRIGPVAAAGAGG